MVFFVIIVNKECNLRNRIQNTEIREREGGLYGGPSPNRARIVRGCTVEDLHPLQIVTLFGRSSSVGRVVGGRVVVEDSAVRSANSRVASRA